MLKIQKIALNSTFALIAALLAIDGSWHAPRSQPQKPPQQTQQAPAPDQRGTEQSPLIVRTIPSPPDEAKAAEEAQREKEKAELDRKLVNFNGDLAFYTKILAGVGALQFVALLMQAYWLARTVKVSEQAADAAKISADAVVSQLRAYISGPEQATIERFGTPTPLIRVGFKNSGQTPAHDVKLWTSSAVAAFPLETPPIPPDISPSADSSVGTLGPGGWFHTEHVPDIPITFEERQSVIAGAAALFVYGQLSYRDVFGLSRKTTFCVYYRGEMANRPSGPLATYHKWNDAD